MSAGADYGLRAAITPAQELRVISTDAALTDIVVALGYAEAIAAIDVTSTAPPGRDALPRVGYHRALSAEGLLSLRPSMLLVSEHAGPADAIDAVAGAGVPVVTLPAALDATTLAANVRRIAASLDADKRGEALADAVLAQRAALQRSIAGGTTALLLRDAGGELRAAGSGTAGGAYLELIGVRNAADHEGYRSFSQEAVLALNPQLLLVAVGREDTLADITSRYPLLKFSDAAGAGALLPIDSAALVGGISLRALDSAAALTSALGARGTSVTEAASDIIAADASNTGAATSETGTANREAHGRAAVKGGGAGEVAGGDGA